MFTRGWLNRMNFEFTGGKITPLGNIASRVNLRDIGLHIMIYQNTAISFHTAARQQIDIGFYTGR